MNATLFTLMIVFALATLATLVVGIVSMVRGGAFNKRNANRLMRLRVILQGVTLLLLVLLFMAR